jgi:D-sedoheptulose 7-phosphate isomerase
MVTQQATAYLQRLCDVMRGIRVSDRDGTEHGLDAGAELAVDMILDVRAHGNKIMIVGNGGSEGVASHFETDLCNAVGVRAVTFDSPGIVTALANDHGYGAVFERPIQLWASPGDVLVAISSSGRSENILRAVDAARHRQCRIVTLSGFRPDNPLRRAGDVNFYVASEAYGFVEVAHGAFTHFLADSAMMLRLQRTRQVTSAVWTPNDRSS